MSLAKNLAVVEENNSEKKFSEILPLYSDRKITYFYRLIMKLEAGELGRFLVKTVFAADIFSKPYNIEQRFCRI